MSTSVEDRLDRPRIERALLISIVLAGCGRSPDVVLLHERELRVSRPDGFGSFVARLELPDPEAPNWRDAMWWWEQDEHCERSLDVDFSDAHAPTPSCKGFDLSPSREELRADGHAVMCGRPGDRRVRVISYVRDPARPMVGRLECVAWLDRGTVAEAEALFSACRNMRIVGYEPRSLAPSSTVEFESREQPGPFAGRLTIPPGFERFESGVPWTVGWHDGAGVRIFVGAWHDLWCSPEIGIELKREVLEDGLLQRCTLRKNGIGQSFIHRVIARDGKQMYCTVEADRQVVESQLRELEEVCKSVEIVAQPARGSDDSARP